MTMYRASVTNARHAVFKLVEETGCDHALTPAELSRPVRTETAVVRAGWALYERHWARFCGARLDPQFWHLDHPGRWAGLPIAIDDAPIVVVGTGPSLSTEVSTLRACREQVHLFTSPRGADRLAEFGLVPDVVFIEHQTPLDAQFSIQARAEQASPWRDQVALVATDARTPAALVDDLPPDRLLILDPLPTWGYWAATAAAVAMSGGARLVGLLGIDLGTADHPDPRDNPLRDLLSLLARGASGACLDFGHGAAKDGWAHASLADIGPGTPRRPLTLARVPWLDPRERLDAARVGWHRQAALAREASAALDAAQRVRDGNHSPEACAALNDHLDRLLDHGSDIATRVDVQDGLGCAFLPRFWRTPPDRSLGPRLWRPLALAAHEVVQQHRTLGDRLLRASRGATA